MKSFAQSKGKEPFNWIEFLSRGDMEDYTFKELDNAMKLSGDWVTCACGNQCDILPRVDGVPEDEILRKLGYDFYHHITYMFNLVRWNGTLAPGSEYTAKDLERAEKNKFNNAKLAAIHTLAEIEARSVELMSKMVMVMEMSMGKEVEPPKPIITTPPIPEEAPLTEEAVCSMG